MKNISPLHGGERSGLSPLCETAIVAGFAMPAMNSKSIIVPMDHLLVPRPLMTSQRSVRNAIGSSPRLSGGAGTSPQLLSPPTQSGSAPRTTSPPPGYKRLNLRIIGASPLIQHNGQLANPLNPIAREMKKVSGKRAKTDADFEQLARLEFIGSLYLSGGQPCIPGEIFEACLIAAAKRARRGAQAKIGIICDANYLLEYDGPKNPDDLWLDESFRLVAGVRVGNARVMRCRPMFRAWASTIVVDFMPDQLDERDVIELAAVGGRIIGLGDWRPKFGRFAVESLTSVVGS